MSSKLVPDLPKGPLDVYRKQASFDWKQMKIFLETEDVLKHQSELYKKLQKYPILFTTDYENASLDEEQRICIQRALTINSLSVFSLGDNLRKYIANICTMTQLDPSMSARAWLTTMFISVVQNLGTERHLRYVQEVMKKPSLPSYCLTEVGHGSNAKQVKTIATYDKKTKEFVLNSPNFEAAKCWAGNLAKTATHAIVFAQLMTADGVNHSMHAFVVQIRNPETHLPYPGIMIGDMGRKIGLNGLDNGFMMFNDYRIPKENLLNRTGDVSEDGAYITPYRDPIKRYGASLGALSTGRFLIALISTVYMGQALTIALRYAAARKQFTPDDAKEISILEYQTHQYRLIPYLSVAYVLKMFSTHFMAVQTKFTVDLMKEIDVANKDYLSNLGLELHAISSASKAVSAWIIRDGIQECREVCAGYGYLQASGLGELNNYHDANCTYEGECHVLIQQTSNWLLKCWQLVVRKIKVSSPLKSIDFLNKHSEILDESFGSVRSEEEFSSYKNISEMYQWLVCYLLKVSHEKYSKLKNSSSNFYAKNESQIYFCQELSEAYLQHLVVRSTHDIVMRQAPEGPIRAVLDKLLSLYSLFCLQKRHVGTLYEGGYARDPEFVTLLHDSILKLCKSLKTDSVALIDAIAPPDFLIRSVLGKSDGKVYKHLKAALLQRNKLKARPDWWTELDNLRKNLNSKL